jgi:hypothetical protein
MMADSDFISEKDIPETWTPVTPQAQQTAPAPPSSGPNYMQGTISSSLQHDSTLAETQYKTAGVPQTPLMPIGSGATAQANATTQSVVNFISGNSGGTTLLQTNSINNSVQTKLNLLNGKNINLTSDQNGGVTIDSLAGGGDGLTHGDAIWEIDPAWLILRDDFLVFTTPSGTNSINNSSGNITSELIWLFTAVSSTYPGIISSCGAFPLQGYIHFINDGTASDANFLRLNSPSSLATGEFPLLDYPGWKLIWVFQPSRITNNSDSNPPPAFNWGQVSFYIGLANYLGSSVGVTSTSRPPFFLGLRYDTSTSGGPQDTQFVCEYVGNFTTTPGTRINTQGTTAATGMTVSEGTTYRFEMSCVTSGQINFLLTNGTTTFTKTMTIAPVSKAGTISSVVGSNGIWQGGFPATFPMTVGTKFTISGGSIAAANGNWVAMSNNNFTNFASWMNSGTQASASSTGATISMFPSFHPFVSFGNDNQASPVNSSKGVMIDFFSLVWNKGLITGGATPNSLLARYW